MYHKDIAVFMFKYRNGLLPISFNNIFTIHKENHKYNTRKKEDFIISTQKSSNIFKIGPKIWNDLPKNIKMARNLSHFKSNLTLSALNLFFNFKFWIQPIYVYLIIDSIKWQLGICVRTQMIEQSLSFKMIPNLTCIIFIILEIQKHKVYVFLRISLFTRNAQAFSRIERVKKSLLNTIVNFITINPCIRCNAYFLKTLFNHSFRLKWSSSVLNFFVHSKNGSVRGEWVLFLGTLTGFLFDLGRDLFVFEGICLRYLLGVLIFHASQFLFSLMTFASPWWWWCVCGYVEYDWNVSVGWFVIIYIYIFSFYLYNCF